MIRLFIGIKIKPLPVLKELRSNLIEILHLSQINWVDPLNYHITLKFLGDVEKYYVNSLTQLFEHIASKTRIFTLQCDQLGFFGSEKQPRVIWFGFEKQHAILKLQSSIEKALTELGFNAEEKEFHPHLTLARIKKINDAQPLMEYLELKNPKIDGEYTVQGFQLIKSILRSDGPEYSVVKEFKLI